MNRHEFEAKVWGRTRCVIKHQVFSVHHITVAPYTWCSVHKHEHRVNMFYVLSGELTVRVWINEHYPQDEVLRAGQSLHVPARVFHQFLSKSDEGAEVMEIYFPVLPDDKDIVRLSEGGRVS